MLEKKESVKWIEKENLVCDGLIKTWDKLKNKIAPAQSTVASFYYHLGFEDASKTGEVEFRKNMKRWKLKDWINVVRVISFQEDVSN